MKINLRTDEIVNSNLLKEYIKKCCIDQNWIAIYNISEIAKLELGILVDNTGKYWIEWGGPGLIEHKPPIGAKLPFQLWLHTHPHGPAYWSIIDKKALLLFSSIVEKAIVLGNDGYLQAVQNENDCKNIWWDKDETGTYFGLNWKFHFFTMYPEKGNYLQRIRRRERRIANLIRAKRVLEDTHPDFMFYINNKKRREII